MNQQLFFKIEKHATYSEKHKEQHYIEDLPDYPQRYVGTAAEPEHIIRMLKEYFQSHHGRTLHDTRKRLVPPTEFGKRSMVFPQVDILPYWLRSLPAKEDGDHAYIEVKEATGDDPETTIFRVQVLRVWKPTLD